MKILLPPSPPEGTMWVLLGDGSWLLVSQQPSLPECVECGWPFDDNGNKPICRTCEDWKVE